MNPTNIENFPVMKTKCATCPFRVDERGRNPDVSLVNSVTGRLLESSQICHHPRLKGKTETHLCRGARDWQLTIFFRLGFLSAPTDEAWSKKQNG